MALKVFTPNSKHGTEGAWNTQNLVRINIVGSSSSNWSTCLNAPKTEDFFFCRCLFRRTRRLRKALLKMFHKTSTSNNNNFPFLKKKKKHRKQIYYVVSALLLLLLQKDKFSQILKKMGAMLLVGGIIRPSTGILQGTFMHNIYNTIPWGK